MIAQFNEITKEPTFISSNFDEVVLCAPARVERINPCNSLKIVTAFTDCERISTHLISLSEGMKDKSLVKGLHVEIILGMTKTSLSLKKHEDICRLLSFINESKDMPKVSCRYISNGPEVHSKIYLWSCPETTAQGKIVRGRTLPYKAFCGSLNYTMNAFYKRRETVTECNSLEAYKYYEDLLKDTIDCFDPIAITRIKDISKSEKDIFDEPDNSESEYLRYDSKLPIGTITVSLLRADGEETGYGSGVNWGIRPNGTKRNPNQAYIPYNKLDKVKGFFPDREHPTDENCPMFRVITKDFGEFHMRMAQAGNKGLHSVESNAILGQWIRMRIGAPLGSYVTKQMLEAYGKTYVTFRKYEDGTYLLDF